MAKLKPVRVDGQTVVVDTGTKLDSLLAPDVQSVRTNQGALITRADFARVPIPDGFETNFSAINKGGAMYGRRPVVIDGTYREVPNDASLHEIVRPEVESVRTSDGAIISRADFAHVPVPAGFETNLSRINKGRSVANVAMAVALAMSAVGLPSSADAGATFGALRGALARRAIKPAAPSTAFGKAAYGKPRDVIIQTNKHPQAAAHIEHAQRLGQPTVLHIDRVGAAKRRVAATGTINPKRKPAPRYERDEYPPAFTREGGSNANVRFISPHDNRGAGSVMCAQTRDLPDGAKIRVLVK